MAKPKQNDETINLRLPGTLANQARGKAQKQGQPLSQVIRDLLRAWLQKQKGGTSRETS